jgi:hypothetical protein
MKAKNIIMWGSAPASLILIQLSGASMTDLSWAGNRPIPVEYVEQLVEIVCTHCPNLLSFRVFGLVLGSDANYAAQKQLHDRFTARIVRFCERLVDFVVDITDTGTGVLHELPSTLQKLSFGEDVQDHGPVAAGKGGVFERVPYLQELKLYIADPELVRGVAQYCHRLVSIDLYASAQVSDQQWHELFTHCSLLRNVFLSRCAQLTAGTLRLLRDLHKLRLIECDRIDDSAVECVVSNSPQLSVLYIDGCDRITYALFSEAFLDGAASLDTLVVVRRQDVYEAPQVVTPLQKLLQRLLRRCCPRLKWVKVDIDID